VGGRIFWTLNATNFSAGMWAAVLGPALPTLAEQMGVGLDEAGALFTADSIGYLVCVLIIGRALDAGNRQLIVASSLGLMAMAVLLLPQAPLLPLAMALVLLIGIGEGTLVTGTSVIVGDLQPHRKAAAINVQQAFYAGGALVAPLAIGLALSSLGSIRPAFWLVGTLLAALVAAVLTIPIPRGAISSGSASSAWRTVLSKRPFWYLLAFVFLYVGVGVGFAGWIFTYVRFGLGASEGWAAAATSGFWAALAVGRALSAWLLRRMASEELLILAAGGAIVSAVALLASPTPALVMAGSMALGLFYAPMIPTAMGIGHADHPEAAGTAVGLINTATAAGWMVIPWLEGKLIVAAGSLSLMWTTLAANGLLLALAVIIWRRWRSDR